MTAAMDRLAGGAKTVAPRPAMIVAATSFGFSLVQLDVTIVNVALPAIGSTLNVGIPGLQWIVDSYALTLAAFLLSAGHLSDRIGARRVYFLGMAIFAMGSCGCGWSTTVAMLVASRVVQGIGAAAMLPASLALLNNATAHDPRLRAYAIGWWTALSSLSIASGPVLGGLLLQFFSWPALFFINLPLCGLAAWLCLRVKFAPSATRRIGFDVPGQVLGMVMIGSLIAAVIECRPLGPAHPLVMALFATSAIAFGSFIRVERRSASPMLPPGLFGSRQVVVCMVYGAVVNLTYYGMVFLLSIYLQQVLGYSPWQAGLAYLPLTGTFFIVNVFCGTLINRYGFRWPMVWGLVVDAAGFCLVLRLDAGSSFLAMLLPFVLMPAGMGTGVPAMTTAMLAAVPKKFSGIASAALNSGRQAGGAAGVALFGSLIAEHPSTVVPGLHAAAAVAVVLLCATAVGVFFSRGVGGSSIPLDGTR